MSERYVTTTSLDCGSCHQQIEFQSFEDMYLAEFFSETENIDDLYLDNFFMKNKCDISTSELPSDEIIPDIKQGKYNRGVEHDEGRAIMDPHEWDPGVTSKDMAPTGCTVNVEPLLLLGFTGAFYFIMHSNDMNQVWDPRRRWSHLLIFCADVLVCASYFDVVGKIHREGIAQVFSSVIAGQTEKILRDHVAFQMVIVFDPGGCTFDVPILEDMNGVLAEISKAWNFSMANSFDGQNRELFNTISQAKRLMCDVKVRGLIVTLKWWPSKHNTYPTTYRTFVLFAILRDLYAHVHTKWPNAVGLVLLVTLPTVALTRRKVITKGKSYFILVGEQSSVWPAARYMVGSSPSELIENYLVDRDAILDSLKANLVRAQTRMKVLADKQHLEMTYQVGDWVYVKLKPYLQNTVRFQQHPKLGRCYFGTLKIIKRIGEVSYKLELPEEARIHPVFHVSLLKRCIGEPNQQHAPLPLTDLADPGLESSSNLEDKVLSQDGGIVVTHTV